jgi:hypothetical protein
MRIDEVCGRIACWSPNGSGCNERTQRAIILKALVDGCAWFDRAYATEQLGACVAGGAALHACAVACMPDSWWSQDATERTSDEKNLRAGDIDLFVYGKRGVQPSELQVNSLIHTVRTTLSASCQGALVLDDAWGGSELDSDSDSDSDSEMAAEARQYYNHMPSTDSCRDCQTERAIEIIRDVSHTRRPSTRMFCIEWARVLSVRAKDDIEEVRTDRTTSPPRGCRANTPLGAAQIVQTVNVICGHFPRSTFGAERPVDEARGASAPSDEAPFALVSDFDMAVCAIGVRPDGFVMRPDTMECIKAHLNVPTRCAPFPHQAPRMQGRR